MSSECSRYELAISSYMDRELPKAEIRPLFLHLAECEPCRTFWDLSVKVERRALKEGWVVASKSLDDRVERIGRKHLPGVMNTGEGRDLHDRSIRSQSGSRWASIPSRKKLSYPLAAVLSLVAGALGIILGMLQPWHGAALERTEPQIVYISVLPDMTVLGHVSDLNRQGESK